MQDPTTWTAGLFGAGAGADDLAEAERRVAILKAELEAIRAGRKEASAAELRKLEREYRDAVAKVQQLRVTARPTVEPRPSVTPRPTVAPRRAIPPPGAVTPVPRVSRTPVPPTPYLPGGPRPAPSPRPPIGTPTPPAGYQVPPQERPRPQWLENWMAAPGGYLGQPLPQPSAVGPPPPAAPSRAGLWRPPGSAVAESERRLRGLGGPAVGAGAGAGGCAFMYLKPMGEWTPAEQARYPQCLREQQAAEREMTEYQAGSLEQQRAEAAALQAYRMAQLAAGQRPYESMTAYQQAQVGQQQATAGATAAWRQQQQQTAADQLKQAWAVAQAELAHAQNVMASQIGGEVAGLQAQIWAQGLPHALPQGTTVAPGFERGGPMSQLYRMSGSQFRPGVTGRISPQPGPSQQQLMDIYQQARQRFGAGR